MSRIAYPSIPREKDRRKDVNAITQTVEVLTGAKGDGLDRALTPRDMAEGGFANISYRTIGGRTLVDLTPVSSVATADKPTVPSGFSANAAFANVVLSWDRALFKGYAYTEIWRAVSDDFGLADRIATSIPNVASDPVAMGSSYYYWIRFVNILGETGPLHDTAGVFAQTAPDVPVLQSALTAAIRESELHADLSSRIDLIDTPTSGLVDTLAAETSDRIADVLDLQNQIISNDGEILANQTDITTLEVTVNHPATGVNANASAIGTLDTRVTNAEGDITTNASDITILEATVNHPTTGVNANASAIGTLDARVTTAEGDITSNASDIISLDATVNHPSTGVSANASGVAALDSRVTATESDIAASASDIAALEVTVNDPSSGVSANASAIGVLDTRVTSAEGDITSNAADITSLESTVNHPTTGVNANTAGISSLDTRVTANESSISTNASDIVALETTVNNPATGVNANASGLAALDVRITANDDDIAAAASDITAIEAVINDPNTGNAANAAAVTSLSVTVSQNGDDITANASAISTIQSTVGGHTSSIQTLQTVQNGLTAEYLVKLDVNGYVSGFGLYNGGSSSTFLVHADKFAIGAPGSTGIIPFIVTTTTTTLNGQTVPAGVYMDQVFIRNGAIGSLQLGLAVIDDAHINNLSATKITAGTLDTARLNIDGSSLVSVGGVLQLGDVNADSITGGALDFQNVTAENLTVANLTGDVSKSFPFSMTSAANLGQGSTTIWAGQIPAPEAAGIGRSPYLVASGWGVFENDDAYRVSLHMRVNQAFSDYALGVVLAAGAIPAGGPPIVFYIYYIEVAGNHTASIRSGGDLSVSSVVKGVVTSSGYTSASNRTTIYYTPVAGGLAVGNNVVADGGPASMDMVASNFFRSSYDYHALNFSICGGLNIQATVSVDAEIRIGIYNAAYKAIPSSVPSDNWSGDQVFGLEGIMMSVR